MDQHIYDATDRYYPAWQPFEVPSPVDATLRMILVSNQDANRLLPSIWDLIATEKDGGQYDILITTDALAASLCAISRHTESADYLVTLFFAPVTFRDLITQMYFIWPRQSGDISLVFQLPGLALLRLCSHIMELRPLWWIEGLNLLSHEDENLEVTYFWYDPVSVSEIQNYAAAITEECLRRGPCYDCPLAVGPLAFDISLRTFSVNPFGVYPIVDTEEDD
ncbi:hypothetical protein EXIGLDRAFT_149032 [Exidia glandulosa HHB12029]|uniref:Uncharacterized protein n=1 Tax=Exidia glandulosa HHB12029 TaxID=1314781 RepID=A0A165FPA1_EXIGL|nr:hypothetical protein EXIGLDRAFT_149032 [Exidia glandulosa HHB12029]